MTASSALAAFAEAGLVAETIGPHGGTVATSGKPMKVNRAAPNAPSVVYDAVFVPAGVGAAQGRFLREGPTVRTSTFAA